VAAAEPVRIGAVTHYWPHANACAVQIEHGELRVGDTVHVRGHTTDYYQRVERIELEHRMVDVARTGDHIGLQVSQRVREGDEVFKLAK
jgi:putative protease